MTRREMVRLLAAIRNEVVRTAQSSDPAEYLRSNRRLYDLLIVPDGAPKEPVEGEA